MKEVILSFEKANTSSEINKLKKLKGGGNYYRLSVGDYRVGIAFTDDTAIFVRFLNRKNIYKFFP